VVGGILQHRQLRFRFARHLYFPNDLACAIHNADARLLDRNVQSSKMVHAALLLLMSSLTDPSTSAKPERERGDVINTRSTERGTCSFQGGITPARIARQFVLSQSDVRKALTTGASKGGSIG